MHVVAEIISCAEICKQMNNLVELPGFLTFASGIIGVTPLAVGFNSPANRYTDSSTKISISKQQALKTGAKWMATAYSGEKGHPFRF